MSRVFRTLATALTFLLIFTVFSPYAPASAVVAACDGSSTQNTMKVTALHGQVVYIDTGARPRLDAAYVSYRVTNTSATSREHIYIELSNFTGNVVRLANPLDSNTIIDDLAGNSSQTTYFLLQASTPTTTDQVHTVKIYDKRPDLGGTVLYTCNYTFTDVKDTIKAKSNKVVSVSTSNTSPVLGELLTFTVEGKTGIVGQGESPDGDIMWFSPSAYASWPTRALRLESISVLLDSDGNFSTTNDQGTYTDQLILKGIQSITLGGPSNKIGSNSRYRAQYNFRVIGSAPNGTKVVPVAQISSGRKIKHTDTAATDTGAFPQLTFDKVDTTININKSAVVVDPEQPAGFSTIKYTLDITTNNVEELLVDEIVDDPDAGIDIVEGSVKFSDNRNVALTTMLDPAIDASNNTHFIGPFYLRASNAARIEYLAYIPRPTEPTSYRNFAFGYIGDRLVGKSNTSVDGIKITSGPDGPIITDDEKSIGPTIATVAASGVATTVSTLNALIDPNENNTAFGFQYSTSATLATSTCVQTAGSASQSNSIDELSYSYSLSGLTANTTYYYRAVANSDSLVTVTDACTTPDLVGEIYSFTTTPQGLLSQSITWTTVFSNLTTSTPLTLTTAATASSTLPVTLTPTNPDVCIVSEQPDPDNATAGYAVITIVGPGTCELTATQDGNASYAAATPVVKSFTVSGVNLNLTIVGSGTVTSDVGNVNCSTSCTKSIRTNTTIVLTATPASGFVFSSWSGACSGSSTCSVTMDSAKSVTATFAAAPYTVDLTVNGNGEVSNSLNADKCTSTCVIGAVFGNSITLTPTAAQGWDFTGWSGACSGSGNCVLSIDGNKTVTATFTKRNARVDVTTRGNGRVVNDYGNPACRGNCSINAYEYESVTLTANPDAGWEFTGWTGACSGTSPTCVISLIPPSSSPSIVGTSSYTISSTSLNQLIKSTEATFQISQQSLNVNVSGNGAVTDSGSLNCTNTCSNTYDYNTVVVLSAQPASGWQFAGWSGACSGTGTCSVTMDAAKSVSALFTQITHTLSLTIIGSGSVTGTSALSCTTDCSKVYNEGDVVTLTASPDSTYYFAGWTGDCIGLHDCTITITRDMNVTAEFTLVPVVTHDLTMNIVGNGSISGDLSCNTSSCIETLTENTSLSLIANADPGWEFTGWSEDCSGTLDCSLTMSADKSVTATFTQITHDLNVTIVGSGSVVDGGTMNCATSCTQTYFEGDVITLTATPISGWQFTGWSEDCSGTSTCELTITSDKNVTATFTQIEHDLTISIIGGGTVGGDYNCNSSPCSQSIIEGSKVSLTATADPGWEFTGWSEDCTGTLDCSLTMTGNMSVTATFVRITHPLDIYITGSGTVTDSGSIACSATSCTETLNDGDVVTLIAIPDSGWEFTGWSSGCPGTGSCTITMNEAKSITATFTRITYVLDISVSGSGSVTNSSTINCTTDCSETFNSGDEVVLTATPDTGYYFVGWSGDCTGTGTCTVTMSSAKQVTATFMLIPIITYDLTLTVVGNGGVSDGGSINCTIDCTETLVEDTQVTLTATPDPGWRFAGWSNGCSGTGTCVITMTNNVTVVATFELITQPLTITIIGNGSVTDSGAISCIESCVNDLVENSVVTLIAIPDSGWEFTGWSAGCPGTGSCTITMNEAKSITATFVRITHNLDIAITGNGSVSDNGSINCNVANCTETLNEGDVITLTATPDPGWQFTGWSGDCTGTGDCIISITGNKAVTATFVRITYTLDITINGNGSVSDGGGINCISTCSETLNSQDVVTLTATPDAGWEFTGWTGACTGTGTCTITMNAAKAVTATFALITYDLDINILGDGTVTDSGSISCTNDCIETLDENQEITLTATPDTGWEFTGWSGACTGTGTCTITMNSDKEVTATFTFITKPLSITISGDGDVSDGGLISCTNSCIEDIAENAVITLTATPDPGWYFAGWSGDCSGMSTCTITMNSAKSVTAEFLLIPIITHDLTINVLGSGKASDGGSIDCRSSCTSSQVDGTSITLTATPDPGWQFTGWSGACTGTGDCNITITADTNVTANFSEIQTVTLTITVIGSGTVLGESIACRDECVYEVERDSIIDLMALADIEWSFEGWGGVCSGVEKCDLSMSSSRSVTATFRPVLIVNPSTLTIKIIGIGEVKVNEDDVCIDECTYSFMPGTDVSLRSSADDDWHFSHWSAVCQSANCNVSMSEDMELTIYFAPPPPSAQYSPALKKTVIQWDAIQAPADKEVIYTISSSTQVLCKTTDLTCSVKGILGPKSSLRITSEMLGMKSDEGPVTLKKGKLLITVRFDFDKFNVKDRYKQKLKRIAKAFAKVGFTKYEIRGHTDNRGNNSYNKLLSRFRAFSVIREMRKFARLTYETTWYGERKPIASNKNSKGRKENRRTEIRIVL